MTNIQNILKSHFIQAKPRVLGASLGAGPLSVDGGNPPVEIRIGRRKRKRLPRLGDQLRGAKKHPPKILPP